MTKAELELLDRSNQQWSVLVNRTESSSPASPSRRRVRATHCPRGVAVWLPVLNVGPYPLNQDGACSEGGRVCPGSRREAVKGIASRCTPDGAGQ